MEFKDILRNALKKNKMTQYRLAKLLGIEKQSVNQWFSGKTFPSDINLVKTMEILDIKKVHIKGLTKIRK